MHLYHAAARDIGMHAGLHLSLPSWYNGTAEGED